MSNDEFRQRLEFLMQSTESLHANLQELHATVAEQGRQQRAWIERQNLIEQREAKLRRAMLQGIRAFLEGLDGEEGKP
jgi:hypothetical protein